MTHNNRMQGWLKPLTGIALLLLGGGHGAVAAGPEPESGEIAASVGDMLHFELASGVEGRNVPAIRVEDPSPSRPVVRVALASDAVGNRTLRIRNSYLNPIRFDFRICGQAPEPACKTVVESFVIGGGEELTQLLQDHADRIIFYNFSRLRDESNGLEA